MEDRAMLGEPASQPGIIHLAYRHGDVDDTAGRIYDRLATRYGRERITRDLFGQLNELPSEPAAQAFLDRQMERVVAQVIVIGPRWLDGVMRPRDIERAEVAAALRRQLPLIPVLAEGATMPAGTQLPAEIAQLTFFNAAQARLDPDFDADMQRLLTTVKQYAPGLRTQTPTAAPAIGAPVSQIKRQGCLPLRILAVGTVVPALLFLLIAIVVSLIGPGATSLQALAATPPATATFLPTPFSAGSYFSSMTDGMHDWLIGGSCKPEANGLHIFKSNNGCTAPDAAAAADGDLSVMARQISGATNIPYGLFFREDNPFGTYYYVFYITSGGDWSAIKQIYKTTSYMATWRPSSAIHTGLGATNKIEVRFKGAELIFFINGQRVGALSDSSIPATGPASDPGSNVNNGVFGDSGAEVIFTDYRLKPIG